MTKDEVLRLALEALEIRCGTNAEERGPYGAITAIREALAQPEQEPVATLWQHGETGRTRITMPDDITDCDARWFKAADLYTTPPHRKPLTSGEIYTAYITATNQTLRAQDERLAFAFARAIETAHGIKD